LLSESIFKIYALISHVGSFQLMAAGALLLAVAALLLAMAGKRRVVLSRSMVTDELLLQLGRIADAMEGPSKRNADRIIAAASEPALSQPPVPPKMTEQTRHILYSVFGR
jgi:hypothetical protein